MFQLQYMQLIYCYWMKFIYHSLLVFSRTLYWWFYISCHYFLNHWFWTTFDYHPHCAKHMKILVLIESTILSFYRKTRVSKNLLLDTGRKLNVHKTFRRRLRRLLSVLCTFSLRPASREGILASFTPCLVSQMQWLLKWAGHRKCSSILQEKFCFRFVNPNRMYGQQINQKYEKSVNFFQHYKSWNYIWMKYICITKHIHCFFMAKFMTEHRSRPISKCSFLKVTSFKTHNKRMNV